MQPSDRFNPAKLEELRELQSEGEPDLVAELVQMFCEGAPKRVQAMREAVQRKDAQAVGREAHSLKSSSANLGADRMAELSRKLEELGRGGSVEGAQELVEALHGEMEHVLPLLKSEASGGSAG